MSGCRGGVSTGQEGVGTSRPSEHLRCGVREEGDFDVGCSLRPTSARNEPTVHDREKRREQKAPGHVRCRRPVEEQ